MQKKSKQKDVKYKNLLLISIFVGVATVTYFLYQIFFPSTSVVDDLPSTVKEEVQQTEDNTQDIKYDLTLENIEDWPLFVSKFNNLSFKYRPDLVVTDYQNKIDLIYQGNLYPDYEKQFFTSIYIVNNVNGYTPEEYAKNELCKVALKTSEFDMTEYCTNLVNENIKTYSNNYVTGISTIFNLYENPTFAVIFPNNGKLILLESGGETGSLPTEYGMRTIDAILSTMELN